MSGFLKFLGGTLFVVAIFGGWWLIDRAQEHLPGPVNAVIDSVQHGGLPYAGPIHWGWPARGICAQPFMTDAAADTEPSWTRTYRAEVDRILDRIEGA